MRLGRSGLVWQPVHQIRLVGAERSAPIHRLRMAQALPNYNTSGRAYTTARYDRALTVWKLHPNAWGVRGACDGAQPRRARARARSPRR